MELKNIFCVKWCIGYLGFGVNEYSYKYFDNFGEANDFANCLRVANYTEVRVMRVQ